MNTMQQELPLHIEESSVVRAGRVLRMSVFLLGLWQGYELVMFVVHWFQLHIRYIP